MTTPWRRMTSGEVAPELAIDIQQGLTERAAEERRHAHGDTLDMRHLMAAYLMLGFGFYYAPAAVVGG